MFKRMVPMVVGAAVLAAIAGCTDPIVPNQETLTQYPQIYLSGYGLQNDILVKMEKPARFGAGQLQVDITLRNLTDHDLNLDYKYYFTDKNQVPIERDTSWQAVRIAKRGIETIEFKSLTASADDFHVELRRQKFE